jgi:hypothetical protein
MWELAGEKLQILRICIEMYALCASVLLHWPFREFGCDFS